MGKLVLAQAMQEERMLLELIIIYKRLRLLRPWRTCGPVFPPLCSSYIHNAMRVSDVGNISGFGNFHEGRIRHIHHECANAVVDS